MSGLVQAQRKEKYDHVQEESCNVGQSVTSLGKLRIGAEETRQAVKGGVNPECSGSAASDRSTAPTSTARGE
jgi:hypothetical protein